jgi:hypothetical protein
MQIKLKIFVTVLSYGCHCLQIKMLNNKGNGDKNECKEDY